MSKTSTIIDVGAQDPELKNSPVISEQDEDYEAIKPEPYEQSGCFFNNTAYAHNSYVLSGTVMLVCSNGIWLNVGNSDLENP